MSDEYGGLKKSLQEHARIHLHVLKALERVFGREQCNKALSTPGYDGLVALIDRVGNEPQPSLCCAIIDDAPCGAPAEWSIWARPDPQDATEACTEHVGHMLQDGKEHVVAPITR